MIGALYLGWRYVIRHRWKTGLLAAAMSLVLMVVISIIFLMFSRWLKIESM